MPLIPYPNVPSGQAGVPIVPVPPAGAPARVPAPNTQSIQRTSGTAASSASTEKWSIVDDKGRPVITPDSVISFEYRNRQLIPNYPVEEGSFASYNKVATPFDIRCILSCGGNGEMTRDAFTQTIDELLDSVELCSFVTPDRAYSGINLVSADYSRRARSGVTLLLAQLTFTEVRETVISTVTTTEPDGAPNSPNGQVSPIRENDAALDRLRASGGPR